MSQNNHMDETSDKAMSTASDPAKKVGKKAGQAGKKALNKATRRMRRKALMLAKKLALAFAKAVLTLLATIWPFVLAFIAFILIFVLMDYFMYETRGVQQEYDYTTSDSENQYANNVNEFGDSELLTLSEENAFLQIFYQNEVDNSYWLYYKDGDKDVLDYARSGKRLNDKVKDKYNREGFFLLSALNLYSMEEYLNGNKAVSPQTFIQHVPFKIKKDGRIEGMPLTNDKGELQVKSQAFKNSGKTTKEGLPIFKKEYKGDTDEPVYTEGVWDYGLAPVYNYESFEEKTEFRNKITGGQIWDQKKQRMRPMTTEELYAFIENGTPSAYDKWGKEYDVANGHNKAKGSAADIPLVVESESRESWMIRDAVTPMGTIKNEIEQVWQATNKIRKETHTISMSVPIEKERDVQKKNAKGKKLWYRQIDQGRYVLLDMPLNHTGVVSDMRERLLLGARFNPGHPTLPDLPTNTTPDYSGITRYNWGYTPKGFPSLPNSPSEQWLMQEAIPYGWGIEWRTLNSKEETTQNFGDAHIVWTKETYYELEEKSHTIETQGVEWEYIPRYVGEPDLSGLTGLDYYEDYFSFYENYVPGASVGVSPFDTLKKAKEAEMAGIKAGTYKPRSIQERLDGVKKTGRKEHPVMEKVRDLQMQNMSSNTTGTTVDLSGINFGKETDSTAVQSASEYLDMFVEHGNTYGVDPMMLLAVAAHESGGRHFAKENEYQSFGVRRSYDYEGGGYSDLSAIGLMQVRPLHDHNPSSPRDVTAYNQTTKQMETFWATAEELHDVNNNIKFAAMLLSIEIKLADWDVLVGIASYHYGGLFAQFVRENGYPGWSLEAEEAYLNDGNHGSYGFVPNVLRYYMPTAENPFPWSLDQDGNKRVNKVEGVDLATDSAVNLDVVNSVTQKKGTNKGSLSSSAKVLEDFAKSPFRALARAGTWVFDSVKTLTDFFGWTDNRDDKNYYHIPSRLASGEASMLTHIMLSYEEGGYLSDYEAMSDEDFEKQFLEAFIKSVQSQENVGLNINPLEFFPDGHQSPVDKAKITVKFGEMVGGNRMDGIQISVPGSTKIYAVADGVILKMTKDSVIIGHENDVQTEYWHLGTVTLDGFKKGDAIKKGEVIGMGAANKDTAIKKDSFLFKLTRGKEVDPTWIVDPSVLSTGGGAGGNLGVDPSVKGKFQHPYFGMTYEYPSFWGGRTHPKTGEYDFHGGQDIFLSGKYLNTNGPIGAIGDGVVFAVSYDPGWGNHIVIHHKGIDGGGGQSVFSLYAHMVSPSPLSVGTTVKAGQVVGYEGTTGDSTGNHLHLEIIVGHGSNPYVIRGQLGKEQATRNPFDFIPR